MTWALEDAKSRLEDLLESSLQNGPQFLCQGETEFVVLPRKEWLKTLRRSAKEVMLAPTPTIEDMLLPERGKQIHRDPPTFE